MTKSQTNSPRQFILQAIASDLGIITLEAKFQVDAVDDLRALLGPAALSDPELGQLYYPSESELASILRQFDVAFDRKGQAVRLHDLEARGRLPYLTHYAYVLPMLLDGTKQFGYEEHVYPPYTHDNEGLFDHHVAAGTLHKEVDLEPFVPIVHKKDGRVLEGFRRAYYTRKGQEWRIPAWRLLWSAAEKQRWNEGFERMSSMLFGYEDWQTERWLTLQRENRGGWGGRALYFAVTAVQLGLIAGVGFRAFPPADDNSLVFTLSDMRPTEEEVSQLLDHENIALVRAFISHGDCLISLLESQTGPSYTVAPDLIPELNRNIVGDLTLIADRRVVSP